MEKKIMKDVQLYEENEKYYLDLRFIIENDKNITEYHVPKIRLPIEFADLSSEWGNEPNPKSQYLYLGLPDRHLECEPGVAKFLTKSPTICGVYTNSYKNIYDVLYATQIIEEKRKDMTIEEIEKKLGYKIKIVDRH